MGLQQILLIVLSVIIVGVSISVGIMMFNAQSEALDARLIDNFLMYAGTSIYAACTQPVSLGGFGGDVRAMNDNKAKVRVFLPQIESSMLSKLTVNGTYVDGMRINFFGYYEKITIGVRFQESRQQRWVLIHCSTGEIEIKNERPRSSDFRRN